MYIYAYPCSYSDELYHHGIPGMKWGVRRYQNEDGTRTALGRRHELKLLDKATNALSKITLQKGRKDSIRSAKAEYRQTKKDLKAQRKASIKRAGNIFQKQFENAKDDDPLDKETDAYLKSVKDAKQDYKTGLRNAKNTLNAKKTDAWAKQSVAGTYVKGALKSAVAMKATALAGNYLVKKGHVKAGNLLAIAGTTYAVGNAISTTRQIRKINNARFEQGVGYAVDKALDVGLAGAKAIARRRKAS